MEDPNLRKASHIGLWIGVIAIGGWLVWSATHSKTKNESFASGSHQTNIYKITKNYGLAFVDLAMMPFTIHGCTKPNKLEEIQEVSNEVVEDKALINAAVNEKGQI